MIEKIEEFEEFDDVLSWDLDRKERKKVVS